MRNDQFRNAVGQIDDRLLERCEVYEQQLAKKKRRNWMGGVAVAACLALIIGLTVPTSLPPKEDILFTAEDIAELFPEQSSSMVGVTEKYQEVYVPNRNDLGIISIPQTDYLPIYQYSRTDYSCSEESVREFVDGIFPALAQALGGTVPEYTVDEYTRIDTAIGEHGVSASQSGYLNYLCISRFPWRSGKATTTTLHGQTLQVDQSQSDEEIIAGLSQIRQILLDIFNVDFPDAKVVRTYDKESDYGAVVLLVYFYDEDAHPLNSSAEAPVSDHIQLWFYNNPGFMEELCSETVLQYVDISYRDWRTDATDMYAQTGKAERLSLHEAETLLKKGYAFGGYRCPFCYPNQDAIDFTDYDIVSFTYLWSKNAVAAGEQVACIPFYVFYKHIGTADNGNAIYAKTYVPAVAVSGLKEYFDNHLSNHYKLYS